MKNLGLYGSFVVTSLLMATLATILTSDGWVFWPAVLGALFIVEKIRRNLKR